jgi:glycosyltransferase involved in cell wall biosynthesis
VKKRILFVINSLGRAGAEVALVELLKNLDPEKYDISLLVLLGQGEVVHALPDYVKVLNKNYDDCSLFTKEGKRHLNRHAMKAALCHGAVFKHFPYVVKHLIRMIKAGDIKSDKLMWQVVATGAPRVSGQFDLAVAFLEGGSSYYVAKYVNAKRKVAFIHIDYKQAGYSRELDQDCYVKFDQVFCVSDEVKATFQSVYPECHVDVFHNIIDQDEIRRKAKLPGGFTDNYNGVRILTVGRLNAQKAFEVSIDAMKLLKNAGVKARWYVLGEGPERPKLEAYIKELGLQEDFILLGANPNPYPYLAQTQLYVHASRYEGKSIAIQEAQTLGCTILVSDCSGNREQVIPEEDGLMCDFTAEAIRDGIVRLLQDETLSRRLAQAAAKKQIVHKEDIEKLFYEG